MNRVVMWHYSPAVLPEQHSSSPPPSPSTSLSSLVEPECVCEVCVTGDVMDMRFLDEERIVVGLSNGDVAILRFRISNQVLEGEKGWEGGREGGREGRGREARHWWSPSVCVRCVCLGM